MEAKDIKEIKEIYKKFSNSNISKNYKFFDEKIKQKLKDEFTLDDILKSLQTLIVVEISLKHGYDNPSAIFESINSTGLPLKLSDKIRNFCLCTQKIKMIYINYFDNH